MNSNIKSLLELQNLYFEKIVFSYNGNKIEGFNPPSIKFSVDDSDVSEDKATIKLQCDINFSKSAQACIVLVGIFRMEGNDSIKRFIPNAIAILFPYLRSEVSLITAQPNIPPIILPAININRLLQAQK